MRRSELPRHPQSSYVLTRFKTVYVAVNKAASTSLKWLVADLQGEDHERIHGTLWPEISRTMTIHQRFRWQQTPSLADLADEELAAISPDDGWFVFTVVRHPASRLFSAWQSKLLLREPEFVERFGAQPWFPRVPYHSDDIVEDFAHCVETLRTPDHPLMANRHFARQRGLVSPRRMRYTRVYRTTELEPLLRDLESHIRGQGWTGERLTLPSANETPLSPVAPLFTPDVRTAISEVYAADFDAFGFEPDAPVLDGSDGYPPQSVGMVRQLIERNQRIGDLAAAARGYRTMAADFRDQAAKPGPLARASRLAGRVRHRLLGRWVSVLLPAVLALGPLLAPAPADARSGSCLIPGVKTKCSIWTGRVTSLVDGDTAWVDLAHSDRVVKVRFTGINTNELTVYSASAARRRGECHGVEAANRLESLLRQGGWRVRLAAIDSSSESHKRWRREVAVKIGGRWRDTGRILVSEGLALWLPNPNEWLWNASYSLLAEKAAAAHRGLWNPTGCGRGPDDAARLALTVNGDADGVDDAANLNGEWVRIRNLDPAKAVNLGGWVLRDTAPRRYRLPDWVMIPPGEELEIHTGKGTDTWTELFMGIKQPIFENTSGGEHGVGDAAFLDDPQGDIRAWSSYPCRLSCADPNAGALHVTADPVGRESITVRNSGSATIDLDGYRLWSAPHVYPFPRATLLGPGAALRVDTVGDPDENEPDFLHWGNPGPILTDSGDTVRLTNLRGVQLDCFAYGAATC